MIDIIICGAKSDQELDTLIINNLSSANNVTIHQTDNIPPSSFKNPVIIFKNSSKHLINHSVPPQAVCILSSENSDILNILSRQSISAISCGMSNKNTFSISSISFPKVSISLQRQIFSLTHKLIEPQEFIVGIKREYEPYSIIATCATILLIHSSLHSNIIL